MDDLIKKSSRPGSRSRFIVEAVASRLTKEHYLKAVKGLAGMLTEEEVPHWKDDKAINKWLADNWKADREALEDKWQM